MSKQIDFKSRTSTANTMAPQSNGGSRGELRAVLAVYKLDHVGIERADEPPEQT